MLATSMVCTTLCTLSQSAMTSSIVRAATWLTVIKFRISKFVHPFAKTWDTLLKKKKVGLHAICFHLIQAGSSGKLAQKQIILTLSNREFTDDNYFVKGIIVWKTYNSVKVQLVVSFYLSPFNPKLLTIRNIQCRRQIFTADSPCPLYLDYSFKHLAHLWWQLLYFSQVA